jgi:hypothetical protein
MKHAFAIIVLVLLVTVSFRAYAQHQEPATLRSVLLEQLRTTHNQADWFVPINTAKAGVVGIHDCEDLQPQCLPCWTNRLRAQTARIVESGEGREVVQHSHALSERIPSTAPSVRATGTGVPNWICFNQSVTRMWRKLVQLSLLEQVRNHHI